jgi:hypothetical protein
MNSLSTDKQTRVIAALVEGVSVNSVVRMTGVSKVTILDCWCESDALAQSITIRIVLH